MRSNKLQVIHSKLSNYTEEELFLFYDDMISNDDMVYFDKTVNTLDIYGEVVKQEMTLLLLGKTDKRNVQFCYDMIKKGSSAIDLLIVNSEILKEFLTDFIRIRYVDCDEELIKACDCFSDKDVVFAAIDRDISKKKRQYSHMDKVIPIRDARK